MENKKHGRGVNMEDDEHLQLCRSFVATSEDRVTGTGQKGDTFFSAIASHYNENLPEGRPKRPTRSLETKWRPIHHDVAKFAGVYVQIKDLNVSGLMDDDVLFRAQRLYHDNSHADSSKRQPFRFLKCWLFLAAKPKWASYRELQAKEKPKKCKHYDAGEGGRHDLTPLDESRPSGTKAAKREMVEQKVKANEYANATSQVADAIRIKGKAQSMQARLALFSRDLTICQRLSHGATWR